MSVMYRPEAQGPREWGAQAGARLVVFIVGALLLGLLAVPLKTAARGDSLAIRSLIHRLSTESAASARLRQMAIDVEQIKQNLFEPALVYVGADGQLITPARIRRFLARHDSPMTRYSEDIVRSGMRHRVDPRVVVAISGVESSYGVYAPGHNAWGWNSGRQRWPSWPVAIESYTAGISTRYHSLRNGHFGAASRTYCPPCGDRWGQRARSIFVQI